MDHVLFGLDPTLRRGRSLGQPSSDAHAGYFFEKVAV